jgi:hypothetical protein
VRALLAIDVAGAIAHAQDAGSSSALPPDASPSS